MCVCGFNCERVLWREMRVMTVGVFINHAWCWGVVTRRKGVFNNCEGGGIITVRGRGRWGNNREGYLGEREALIVRGGRTTRVGGVCLWGDNHKGGCVVV